MTFLQALYGSQYLEITQNGGDGNQGRFNGNMFLAAMVTMGSLIFFSVLMLLAPNLDDALPASLSGWISGSALGKLLALPLMVAGYQVANRTVGSPERFRQTVEEFLQLPEKQQASANNYLLIRLAVLIALTTVVVIMV